MILEKAGTAPLSSLDEMFDSVETWFLGQVQTMTNLRNSEKVNKELKIRLREITTRQDWKPYWQEDGNGVTVSAWRNGGMVVYTNSEMEELGNGELPKGKDRLTRYIRENPLEYFSAGERTPIKKIIEWHITSPIIPTQTTRS